MNAKANSIINPVRGIAVALAMTATAILPLGAAAAPQAAGSCGFVLGFQSFHESMPDIVGECETLETYHPETGDATQMTSKGMLVWRRADNTMAFTDGYRTWVAGPQGVEQRLNTERLAWEQSEANEDNGGLRPAGVSDDPAGHDLNDDKGGLRAAGASDDPAGHDQFDDNGGLRPAGVSDDPAGHDQFDDNGGLRAAGVSDDPAGHDQFDDNGGR